MAPKGGSAAAAEIHQGFLSLVQAEEQGGAPVKEAEAPVKDGAQVPEPVTPEPQAPETPTPEAAPAVEEPVAAVEAEPSFPVVVDGKEETVSLADLKRGYSAQAWRQQRMETASREAKLAEQKRREAEQHAEAAARLEADYHERLKMADAMLRATLPPEEDLSTLRASNPTEYAVRVAERTETERKLSQLEREQQRVAQRQAEEQQRRFAQHLADEQTRLREAVPEWKDDSVFAKDSTALVSYAKGLGYSEQEIANVADHRALVLLRKAHLYDQLKAQVQAPVPGGARSAPKVPTLKPGASARPAPTSDRLTQAMAQLAKSGKSDDARAAFFEMLSREGA